MKAADNGIGLELKSAVNAKNPLNQSRDNINMKNRLERKGECE